MSAVVREVEAALEARWPESRLAPSLDRMRAVMALLGSPQHAVPAIHITGTNGKTSTARMVDGILRASGRRTGRYTSPHLTSVRERIVIEGQPLSETDFVAVHDIVLPAVREVDAGSDVPMSFFEVITAMAFVAFARAGLDAVVVEVGMGGTWDATNVVDGQVAVVTPISLDHTEYLGPDETAIAREKAGIIKEGADVVLAEQQGGPEAVLLTRIAAVGASLRPLQVVGRRPARVGDQLGQLVELTVAGSQVQVTMPLIGDHQADNAAVALTAATAFLSRHGDQLTPLQVARGLGTVRAPGRLQVVSGTSVVVDASHNPSGMAVTVRGLPSALGVDDLVVVLAVLTGKDAAQIVAALEPVTGLLVVTANDSPRALPAADLELVALTRLPRDRVLRVDRLADAIPRARDEAARRRRAGVLVTGSVVTAGQATDLLESDRRSSRPVSGSR